MRANVSKSSAKLHMSRAINQIGRKSTACTRRNHGIQFRYFSSKEVCSKSGDIQTWHFVVQHLLNMVSENVSILSKPLTRS